MRSAAEGRKKLREHVKSVEHRLLPHLRKKGREERPAWVERKVAEGMR